MPAVVVDSDPQSTKSKVKEVKRELERLVENLKGACGALNDTVSSIKQDLADGPISADSCLRTARTLSATLESTGEILTSCQKVISNKGMTDASTYCTDYTTLLDTEKDGDSSIDFDDYVDQQSNSDSNGDQQMAIQADETNGGEQGPSCSKEKHANAVVAEPPLPESSPSPEVLSEQSAELNGRDKSHSPPLAMKPKTKGKSASSSKTKFVEQKVVDIDIDSDSGNDSVKVTQTVQSLPETRPCAVELGLRVDDQQEVDRLSDQYKLNMTWPNKTKSKPRAPESSSEDSSDSDDENEPSTAPHTKPRKEEKKQRAKKSFKKPKDDAESSDDSLKRELRAAKMPIKKKRGVEKEKSEKKKKKDDKPDSQEDEYDGSQDLFADCDDPEAQLEQEAKERMEKLNGMPDQLSPQSSPDDGEAIKFCSEGFEPMEEESAKSESPKSNNDPKSNADNSEPKSKLGGGGGGGTTSKKPKKAKKEESDDSDVVDLSKDSSDNNDSSDEELSKIDKLLSKNIALSDDSDAEEAPKKKTKRAAAKKREKPKKRKRISDSDDSSEGDSPDLLADVVSDENSDSESDAKNTKSKAKKKKGRAVLDSDSDEPSTSKRKQKAKKKRIRTDSDSDAERSSGDDEHNTSQGRKKIKKIYKSKQLQKETVDAEKAERQRRKRLEEMQKEFNGIVFEAREEVLSGKVKHVKQLVLDKYTDEDDEEQTLELHPSLCRVLKEHQAEGIQFLYRSAFESIKRFEEGDAGGGGILAHCMGLGKTLQVVAFVHAALTCPALQDEIRTVLVLVPVNVLHNWHKEFQMWLDENDPELNELEVYRFISVPTVKARVALLEGWQKNGGVMIMGYDIYRRLVDDNPKGKKLKGDIKKKIHKCLRDPGPSMVICDEGHKLKSDETKLSKMLTQIKTRRRLCLTGTPLQNNLIEYHCMVNFVKPGLLGTKKEFTNRFVNPIKNGQYVDSTRQDVKLMKFRSHVLYKLLDKVVLRRDYRALAAAIPPKHEFVLSVRLCDRQIKLYQYFLDKQVGATDTESLRQRSRFLLADYHILSRIWTHPYQLMQHESDMHQKREREELFREDDDFVVSGSGSESFDSDSSKAKSKSGSDVEEVQEVIKKHHTRRTAGEDLVEPLDNPEGRQTPVELRGWWGDSGLVKEEDQYDSELSGKLTLLFDILKKCEKIGDKVLLFSQSLESLNLIESFLQYYDDSGTWFSGEHKAQGGKDWGWCKGLDYFRLDGSVSVDYRKKFQDRFNHKSNHRARLFLISTRAGSLGINMVAANRVIIFDACWNPSHDTQSLFRVYRFGQTKPVYIYRFIAQGTMEERIYDRQVAKESLALRVVDEQQIERHLNCRDLEELYRFNPDAIDPDANKDRPQGRVPQDRLLADVLLDRKEWIVRHHEHDSLLQHKEDETLSKDEQDAAWKDYELDREGRRQAPAAAAGGYGMPHVIVDPMIQYYGNQSGLPIEIMKILTVKKDMIDRVTAALPQEQRFSIRDSTEYIKELMGPYEEVDGVKKYRTAPELLQAMEQTVTLVQQKFMTPEVRQRMEINEILRRQQQMNPMQQQQQMFLAQLAQMQQQHGHGSITSGRAGIPFAQL